jgi:ParB family chromosome partitioning protein
LITGNRVETPGVTSVPVDDLEPNPFQPRSEWNPEKLEELAASIREHGVIQPLIVTRSVGKKPYQIIAGERRWRASQAAGLREVPVIVREITTMEALEIALVENVQRADLNPIEEALAYRQLVGEFKLTQEQIAERVGKSRSAVANTLRLLDAPEDVRAAVVQGTISAGHARALLAVSDRALQLELFRQVIEAGLNVRQTERLVATATRAEQSKPSERETALPSPDERAVQLRLQQHLGTRVDLRRGPQGGRIVIHFYSDEELNGILSRIDAPD